MPIQERDIAEKSFLESMVYPLGGIPAGYKRLEWKVLSFAKGLMGTCTSILYFFFYVNAVVGDEGVGGLEVLGVH